MEPLTEYSVTARPDRCIIEVYDVDAYLGDQKALDASRLRVVAGNGYHLYLHSLQPDIPVHITIRTWATPPHPPEDAEGTTPITLESETGLLVINQLTFGPAGECPLPRPGVYEGHAWWNGREATSNHYDQTLRRIDENWSIEQIGQAWAESPARESYVLDLAFTGPPLPVDDD
ncbi:hypothetical protein [Streptomyces sp. NPDC006368]|uniref:hypothetical protein n=1 Tax=Streptomyces sp. NPDC006368 TaxID=3156760 RepID=UPI0033B5E5D7